MVSKQLLEMGIRCMLFLCRCCAWLPFGDSAAKSTCGRRALRQPHVGTVSFHCWGETDELSRSLVTVCSGASIAIDDCYELWESGFISIPHNFQVKDLRPELRKLLSPSNASPSGASDSLQPGETTEFPSDGNGLNGAHERGNAAASGAGAPASSAGAEPAPSAAVRSAGVGSVTCLPPQRQSQRSRGFALHRMRGFGRGVLFRPRLHHAAFLLGRGTCHAQGARLP